MIGGLRFQIDVLARAATPDGGGGAATSYATAAQIWAAVDMLPAVTDVTGARIRRLKRIRALVRARPDLVLGARVRHAGDVYEIVSVESDDARGRRLFLTGEEVPS